MRMGRSFLSFQLYLDRTHNHSGVHRLKWHWSSWRIYLWYSCRRLWSKGVPFVWWWERGCDLVSLPIMNITVAWISYDKTEILITSLTDEKTSKYRHHLFPLALTRKNSTCTVQDECLSRHSRPVVCRCLVMPWGCLRQTLWLHAPKTQVHVWDWELYSVIHFSLWFNMLHPHLDA